MWSRNTVSEISYISFFWDRDHILWSSATAGEHTRGSWQVCLSDQRVSLLRLRVQQISPLRLSDQRVSPFRLSDQRISAFGPKLQTLYCLSNILSRKYEHPLRLTYFLFMVGNRSLHTSVFFPVYFCFYLRTEMSVILSTSNKLHFSLSCETTLLMLSCDHIESVKFIVAS